LDLNVTLVDWHANLSWNAPSSDGGVPVTSYRIFRGNDQSDMTLLATVDTTWYLDGTTQPGQAYYYAVAAVNEAGEGPATIFHGLAIPKTNQGGALDGTAVAVVAILVVAASLAALLIWRRRRP
jgi:titin